jgi:hypothetical protein
MKTMKKTILIATVTTALTAALTATPGASATSEEDLLLLARDAATIAGGARYCKADDELIEEYMAKADAQIAFRAKDDYEKVLARLEFKNVLAAMSAREPQEGCKAFVPKFAETVKKAR